MQSVECHGNPELRAIVLEASRALALLDTHRLEDLGFSCRALNKTLTVGDADIDERKDLARQAGEAKAYMALFVRVLKATRANMQVMNRLREMRAGRLEYTVQAVAAECVGAVQAESGDGDH